MRLIAVDAIKECDKLGKTIYSADAALLLSAGVDLSPNMVRSLKKNNIYYVYIEDGLSQGIDPKPIIPDEVKVRSVAKVEKIMTNNFNHKVIQKGKALDEKVINEFKDIVKELLDILADMPERLYNMVELMGTDMYTYSHSVNVAVMSMVIGLALKLDREKIQHMSLGALMHDLGKMFVSEEVLNKPENLTPDEFDHMKEHVTFGYELVKDDIALSGITKQIVYGHHERLDGTGYPRGLVDPQISLYTRIVSICDMFDALTTNRVYQTKMPVYKAIDVLMAEAIHRIDADLLKTFINNIAIYKPGEIVILEDGRKGVVVEVKKGYATRPVVRIIEDALGQKPYEIDLRYNLSLFIKDVVDQ